MHPAAGVPAGIRALGARRRCRAVCVGGCGSRGHLPCPEHSPRLPGAAIRRFGSASCRSGVPPRRRQAGSWVPGRAGPRVRRRRETGPVAAGPTPPAEVCGERTWACFAQAVSKHNRNSSLTSRAFQTVPSSGEILQGTRGSGRGTG